MVLLPAPLAPSSPMDGFMSIGYHGGLGCATVWACGTMCGNGAEPSELVTAECRTRPGGSPPYHVFSAWGVGGPFLESDPAGFIPVGPPPDGGPNRRAERRAGGTVAEQLEFDFGEPAAPTSPTVTFFDPILGAVQAPADLYGE